MAVPSVSTPEKSTPTHYVRPNSSKMRKIILKEDVRHILSKSKGITIEHLLQACLDEFHENEDLPNTTNPDDWSRISGKKGDRIVFMRTLIHGKKGDDSGRSIDTSLSPNPFA